MGGEQDEKNHFRNDHRNCYRIRSLLAIHSQGL